ncbi:hypothetical protein Tco_1066597 [Tanacetum coccineum]|uniref:Uncharacterized protein n=1 Tax=Tanacetum coccineum TaxID=301880 RepID=A0ABQ5HB10_9ASTR
MDLDFAADGNLGELSGEEAWEAIENFTQGQKEWDNPPNIISEQEVASLKAQAQRLFGNEDVWVEIHRGIAWDKVENSDPQSTPQVLPSFEEYTPLCSLLCSEGMTIIEKSVFMRDSMYSGSSWKCGIFDTSESAGAPATGTRETRYDWRILSFFVLSIDFDLLDLVDRLTPVEVDTELLVVCFVFVWEEPNFFGDVLDDMTGLANLTVFFLLIGVTTTSFSLGL